jgi:DNA-binding transcriptional MerR regulator
MGHYTIKDLEKLSGIKAHTIRIWEKRYSLIEPKRTSTNIRTYCDDELKKLLNVSILNRNGHKISKIAKFSKEEIHNEIKQLLNKSDDIESQVENLAIAMIDLDEIRFEKILSRAIIQLGFQDTVIKILNPFLIRIGIMWQTGSINPAQEHFVSNLIRQKMLVAIDSQIENNQPNAKTFILFLPEGELHEMSLLFASYVIRKKGHKVIYLGQSVPLSDLVAVGEICSPDYFLTSFITSMADCDILNYLQTLNSKFSEKICYVTGNQAIELKDNLPDNTIFINSPLELSEELDSLT